MALPSPLFSPCRLLSAPLFHLLLHISDPALAWFAKLGHIVENGVVENPQLCWLPSAPAFGVQVSPHDRAEQKPLREFIAKLLETPMDGGNGVF